MATLLVHARSELGHADSSDGSGGDGLQDLGHDDEGLPTRSRHAHRWLGATMGVVMSDATTAEGCLALLPDDRRTAITAVRDTIVSHLPAGFEEVMQYGTRYENARR